MVWLLAQVWVLCAVAFLLGAAVTWLLFGRPQRRPPSHHPERPHPIRESAEPGPDRTETAEPDGLGPRADPALAVLDGPTLGMPAVPGAGTRASGALDLLGVARPDQPVIPSQAGPRDDGPARPGRRSGGTSGSGR